jgi:hypothetical protein
LKCQDFSVLLLAKKGYLEQCKCYCCWMPYSYTPERVRGNCRYSFSSIKELRDTTWIIRYTLDRVIVGGYLCYCSICIGPLSLIQIALLRILRSLQSLSWPLRIFGCQMLQSLYFHRIVQLLGLSYWYTGLVLGYLQV